MCRFYITLNTRVPHASKRSKTTLLPTYECTVRINGPRMLATILSTMPHAPEALEGSTPRPRCHHNSAQHAASPAPTRPGTSLTCAAHASDKSAAREARGRHELED